MTYERNDFWKVKGKYRITDTSDYTIWLSGVLSYGEKENDISRFAYLFLNKMLDFNTVIGWYRIVIFDKKKTIWFFFGDNSNSQHFFYNEQTGCFSDSLLYLKKMNANNRPNYTAIANLLGNGYMINKDTVVEGLCRTDKDCYYSFDLKETREYNKGIKPLNSIKAKQDVKSIICPISSQTNGNRTAAVCTGGTDSRVVISGLNSLGYDGVEYVITGHEKNPDLKVASLISKTLNKPLSIIDPDVNDPDWLEKGFDFTDGEYDVVLSYRHYLKSLWEKEKGIEYEFGGLAGEFYKNVFCHPFMWLFKKKDSCFFYNVMLKNAISGQKWIGENIKKAIDHNAGRLKSLANAVDYEQSLLEKGNRLGYDILSWKSGAITNGYSSVATKIDPLMDRQLCSSASHDNCLSHSMHMWQRKEINKYCKEISNLTTDQGYNCSFKPLPFIRDCIKRIGFYIGRVFNRIRRRAGFGFKSLEQKYWDDDYCKARETEIWKKSLCFCKDSGIISNMVSDDEIPIKMTGWIILVGLLFC